MRHALGLRVLIALCAVLAGTSLACGGKNGDGNAAGQRLASTGVAGVGSGSDGGEAADELEDVVVIEGSEAMVEARDNTFDAENIQVAPGTKVVWTNNGRQDHDILPVDDVGWGAQREDFTPDAVYEHTFDEPGTYRYFCSLHGTAEAGMTGTVVVEE